MLPIYGSGAVMMLWVSIPFQDSLFLTWCSGVLGATILEYVTGYVMELLFKVRYWDYSNQKFNLHGYICLSSSIAWGFLTIFMTHLIHKPIERGVLSMPLMWNLCFVVVVTVAFVYDSVVCAKQAFAFGKSLEAVKKLRQELDTIQLQAALLKMEAGDRLSEAGSMLSEAGSKLSGAGSKLSEAGDRLSEARSGLIEQLELRYDKAASLKDVSLEELKSKAGTKLESLRGKSEQQLFELSKEKEAALAALRSGQMAFRKKLSRSNPSVSSHKYAKEFKDLMEYLEKNGKGQSPL